MTPFTILLPHRRNPGNNRALKVALECIQDNTITPNFLLNLDCAVDEPLYERINRMVQQASTDCVIYWSSDMFPAPGWDKAMLDVWNKDTIVTNVVVEPGVIGVHPDNLEADFGRLPETFARQAFEDWCINAPVPLRYWFAPYMVSRSAFLDIGGLQTNLAGDGDGFSPADVVFFEQWLASGRNIVRARSFLYHLQRYSQVHEQEANKRK